MSWILQRVKSWIANRFLDLKWGVWMRHIFPFLKSLEKEKDYVLLHVDDKHNPTSDEIIIKTELTKGEANFTNDFHKDAKTGMFYFSMREYKKIFKKK